MKLIVGLGNPGLRYKNTRHNAGFLAIDYLAKKHKIAIKKKAYNGITGQGRINGEHVLLLKPLTFMNLSGVSVMAAAAKIEDIGDLLVIYDDIALDIGYIRLRPSGSSAGHNGLKSVIGTFGSKDIPRLKIGINPANEVRNTSDFVLKPFSKDEMAIVKDVIKKTCSAVEVWIKSGIDKAMAQYN